MDNYCDPGDLMVTGIYRTRWWRLDSHLDRDSGHHLDIQPSGWPSRGLSHTARKVGKAVEKIGKAIAK